ncbi:hypothetical protein, partial [Methylobacterium brachythecii]|uniref:hypothetical protein n=2 Tax=Methylobacterium brachythecii TaxID=1176177 RepID=UPI0024E05F8B
MSIAHNDNIPPTTPSKIDIITPDAQKQRLRDLCETLPAEEVAQPDPQDVPERPFEKPDPSKS